MTRRVAQAVERALAVVGIQVMQVVLEGVRDEPAAHPDGAVAAVHEPSFGAERRVHRPVERVVVRMLDVAAVVPGESLAVGERPGEPPGGLGGLQEFPVAPQFLEPLRGAESGRAGADNDDIASIGHRSCHFALTANERRVLKADGTPRVGTVLTDGEVWDTGSDARAPRSAASRALDASSMIYAAARHRKARPQPVPVPRRYTMEPVGEQRATRTVQYCDAPRRGRHDPDDLP